MTRDFVTTLYGAAEMSVVKGRTLKEAFAAIREAMDTKFGSFAIYEHCLPFNVARAFDEASGNRRSCDLDRGARSPDVGSPASLNYPAKRS